MKRSSPRRVVRQLALDRACVIREDGEEYCIYPLDDVLAVLGKKWALFIVSVLGNERKARFRDLRRSLLGISPRILTDRLRELEEIGLVRRAAFAGISAGGAYALTEDGRRMRRALIPFLRWSIDFETARRGLEGP